MYEYRIVNKTTEEEIVIFGYTYADACKRKKIDPNENLVINCEYVD
jgi:hypothetical protein